MSTFFSRIKQKTGLPGQKSATKLLIRRRSRIERLAFIESKLMRPELAAIELPE